MSLGCYWGVIGVLWGVAGVLLVCCLGVVWLMFGLLVGMLVGLLVCFGPFFKRDAERAREVRRLS